MIERKKKFKIKSFSTVSVHCTEPHGGSDFAAEHSNTKKKKKCSHHFFVDDLFLVYMQIKKKMSYETITGDYDVRRKFDLRIISLGATNLGRFCLFFFFEAKPKNQYFYAFINGTNYR